jgi:hypothetical protein
MLKNVPNRYGVTTHVDLSQTLTGQSLEPVLALKNVEVPLGLRVTIMYSMTIVRKQTEYPSYIIESVGSYKAHTNFPFLLSEATSISQLLHQGLSIAQIKAQVIDPPLETLHGTATPFLRNAARMEHRDILQIRSKASRQGAWRVLEQLLNNVPHPYIQFLATGHSDLRRYTLLFLTLRTNRLLREVISEVLLERLKSLDRSLDRQTIAAFFDRKCEQEQILGQWSKSTYQKVCSNTVLILVRSGLLIPSQDKKTYEIQAMPIPFQLKQQLQNDGLELYLRIMLN